MNRIIQPTNHDRDRATQSLNALRQNKNTQAILGKLEPDSAIAQALETILEHFARGTAISVNEVKLELTTQEAADWLQVSRPHLVGLLERGEIPFHKVGNQRRVRFDDVKTFQKSRREAVLDELSRYSQEIGL